jgi:hypothetical protein
MRPNDRAEFLRILNALATVKPGANLTPDALDMWWAVMKTWSIHEFRVAAEELTRTHEFFPNPYHFDQLRKQQRLTAGEAWNRARAACGTAIQHGQVTDRGSCGNPLIDIAVRVIGGYGAIAMCPLDKLTFLERRFAEHFEEIRDARELRESLPELTPSPLVRRLIHDE